LGRKLREPAGRTRWLSPAEAVALVRAAERIPKAEHLSDFIRLGLYTGMRPGELLYLEWGWVNLSRHLVYFGAGDQKNGKVSSIPLNRRARDVLIASARFGATHCPAAQWLFRDRSGARINSIEKGFAAAAKRANIPHCTPHDLRQTCASWLVQARTPIQEVTQLLRVAPCRHPNDPGSPCPPDAGSVAQDRRNTGSS